MSLSYRKVKRDFFKENPDQDGLLEEYDAGTDMPEFAVIAPNGVQIGQWMRCKDYIQDVWWGHKNQKDYECHGFRYNPKKDPEPSKRFLLIGMRWKSKSNKISEMLANIKLTVENLEKRLSIPVHLRTKFSRHLGGGMFVVYGSPKWLNAICLVSFFTWVLRSSFNNKSGKLEDIKTSNPPVKKDIYYASNGAKFIEHLFDVGVDGVDKDWDYANVYQCHDGGFVSKSRKLGGDYRDYEYDEYDEEDDDWDF